MEARYTYQSYIIPEEDRAEKQQYRRSAARELTEKDRKKLKRASALGKLGLPHSRLGGQHRQKRRKLSSRSEDASVSDSEDTAPSPTASDLTDVNEIEPAGYRSLVMARSCKADLVDMSPIPFISSREYLQDLEPFYYRCWSHY